MGQNRTDSNQQIAAKERVAERLRCPACQRRAALSSKGTLADHFGSECGWWRECRYCGHVVEHFSVRVESL